MRQYIQNEQNQNYGSKFDINLIWAGIVNRSLISDSVDPYPLRVYPSLVVEISACPLSTTGEAVSDVAATFVAVAFYLHHPSLLLLEIPFSPLYLPLPPLEPPLRVFLFIFVVSILPKRMSRQL